MSIYARHYTYIFTAAFSQSESATGRRDYKSPARNRFLFYLSQSRTSLAGLLCKTLPATCQLLCTVGTLDKLSTSHTDSKSFLTCRLKIFACIVETWTKRDSLPSHNHHQHHITVCPEQSLDSLDRGLPHRLAMHLEPHEGLQVRFDYARGWQYHKCR